MIAVGTQAPEFVLRGTTANSDPLPGEAYRLSNALEDRNIEHLVVNDTRIIAIYHGVVIRLDTNRRDQRVESIDGRVLESPTQRTTNLDRRLTQFTNALDPADDYPPGPSRCGNSDANTP